MLLRPGTFSRNTGTPERTNVKFLRKFKENVLKYHKTPIKPIKIRDTPYLAGTVLKTFAAKGRGPILQRHKLYDGVHADDLLIEEWAKKIQTAIENSRSRPDDIMPGLHHHTPYHLALILEGIKLY